MASDEDESAPMGSARVWRHHAWALSLWALAALVIVPLDLLQDAGTWLDFRGVFTMLLLYCFFVYCPISTAWVYFLRKQRFAVVLSHGMTIALTIPIVWLTIEGFFKAIGDPVIRTLKHVF